MIAYSDFIAAEHLQVHTTDEQAIARKLRNYGSLFVGELASIVHSDKCCGINHTLPAMGGAATPEGYGSAPMSKSARINGSRRVASQRSHRLLPGKARARPSKVIVARRSAASIHCRSQPDFPIFQPGP